MMRNAFAAAFLCAALLASGGCDAATASGVNDRLTVMLSGASLRGGSLAENEDGGGVSLGWLHNFSSSTVLGLAAQHQRLADSRWSFGSLSFAHGLGQADRRTHLYGEVHLGSGEDDVHSYDYSVAAVGLIQNVTGQLSVQIEDRQIDIDATRGNLPRIGFNYVWGRTVSASLSYSHSVSGNLGTRLTTLRVDRYGRSFNLILGGAGGEASPAVLDIQTGIVTPGLSMQEYFAGITRPFSRGEVTLLADYLDLADTERYTLTLNVTIGLRRGR